jgi:hypothetical protein
MTEIQNPKPVYDLEENFFVNTGEVKIAKRIHSPILVIGFWDLRFI